MIDSHCHLDMFEDLEEVLERAARAGVEKILTISTNLKEMEILKGICQRFPKRVAMTLGIHPEEIADVKDEEILEAFAIIPTQSCILGVGEIGLDYHQHPSEASVVRQKDVFRLQLELARSYNKPVSVHTRDAIQDTLEIVSDFRDQKIVFHCFGENVDFARKILDLGFFISLSGIVTFKNAVQIQEVARFVPLDRLLVETDAPFLAPVPKRGQRNEPAYVVHTAEFVAQLRGIPIERLDSETTRNFHQIFSWSTLT